jgi:hypothetical protein
LDSNTDVLYDDRGGAGDITIATAEFGKAMASSQSVMEQIAAGTLTVTARSLDGASGATTAALVGGGFTAVGSGSAPTAGTTATPEGTVFDGPNGFLFKPISENQKTLAVLLPEVYKGLVSGVTVLNSLGEVLDSGASTGYGEEGTREKFSFSKPGGDYGDNLTVNVSFMDGTSTAYSIPDGSKRYD